MSIIQGMLIFFAIVCLYFLIIFILKKMELLEKFNMTIQGPFLLIHTSKGINFLKKISKKKRFWRAYGSTGVVICFIVMIIMVTIFVWQAWMIFGLDLTPEQKASLPGPETALILPGINPILPLEYIFYILLAFIVAIIVHEFSHGILALAQKIKVKSLGLIFIIIPMGAFCEPDEEELKKTQIVKRMRIYAAGPLSNFTVAFVLLLVFSFILMPSIQHIDGAEILYVYEDTTAEEIGVSPGSVIISFNDTEIITIEDFSNAINKTSPNQQVNISYSKMGVIYSDEIELKSLYNYTVSKNESFKNITFFGVGFNIYGEYFTKSLREPLTYDFPSGFSILYGLPILGYMTGYNPIASPYNYNFEIIGPLSVLPTDIFWVIVNAVYWIFWLNLLVGIFNSLPIGPFDGGHLFNDALNLIVKKLRKNLNDEKREKIVKNISLMISLIVLFLILFPFFIKYF